MSHNKRNCKSQKIKEEQAIKKKNDQIVSVSHDGFNLHRQVVLNRVKRPTDILELQRTLGNRFTRRYLSQNASVTGDKNGKIQMQPDEELDPEWYKESEWYKGQQDWRYKQCKEGKGEFGESMKGDEAGCREQVEQWTGKEYYKESRPPGPSNKKLEEVSQQINIKGVLKIGLEVETMALEIKLKNQKRQVKKARKKYNFAETIVEEDEYIECGGGVPRSGDFGPVPFGPPSSDIEKLFCAERKRNHEEKRDKAYGDLHEKKRELKKTEDKIKERKEKLKEITEEIEQLKNKKLMLQQETAQGEGP